MRKSLRAMGLIIVVLTLLVFISNILMNRIFFNPYRNYEINSKVFNLSVQTFMPNYSYAYISVHEPGTPKSFSRFSQEVKLSRLSAKHDINHNVVLQGNMSYLLGEATFTKTQKTTSKNIFIQHDFSPEQELKETTIKEDSYYIAHISFHSPLSTEEVLQIFLPKLQGGMGDLVRIIVKTSQDENAIAMGMDYQSSFFVFGQGGYTSDTSANQAELIFKNNLRFLKENEEVLRLYLKSGFFGDVEININERIDYINNHKFENIGIVLFSKGEVLKNLLRDPNFFIPFLDEDV